MKIAAVIVAFYPDKELLRKNIMAFANNVDVIIIWRNSADDLGYLDEWSDKIIFMGNGQNEFMAKPLNITMDYCYEKGYDFLLTMDQDSCWDRFDGFIRTVTTLPMDGTVAIYAPNVNNYLKDPSVEYKDIEWVIQSGMLIDLQVVKGLGGFREDYQIYGVDEEYCYWLRRHDKKIRSFTHYHLKQKYGDCQKSRWGFYVYNYSPTVRYYLIRNMIWMKREFPDSTITRRIIHVFLLNLRDILLAEKNKTAKCVKLCQGVWHGLFDPISKRLNTN